MSQPTTTEPIRYRYWAQIGCADGHLTETPFIGGFEDADGMVNGSLGSDADFCAVCDTDEVTILAALDRGPEGQTR